MKALFIHPSHPNQFTGIAHRLAELGGWECAFLVDDRFTDSVRAESPPIPYYGFPEDPLPPDLPLLVPTLEEAARRGKVVLECVSQLDAVEGFDVVVGHACFGTTYFLAPLLAAPVVSYVELPGHFTLYARPDFPPVYEHAIQDIPLRTLVHSSALHSELVVMPSAYARELLPPELQDKTRVQMEGFATIEPVADRARTRRELGLPEDGPLVGFTGRSLEAVRGFDVFLRAARRIRRERPDAHFLVIGEEETLYGPETAYLEGRSFKRWALEREGLRDEEILFRSFLPRQDFVRHLQVLDLAIFPLFEGAANWGVFEAMAAGLPVLASNRCFVPEAITDGREGLLFEPDDAEGFARAALAILEDPERFQHLGEGARRRIAESFSEDVAAAGWAAILDEAVARAAARQPEAQVAA